MSYQPGVANCFNGGVGYTALRGGSEGNLESGAKTESGMKTKVYLFLLLSILIFFSFLSGCALYDPTAFLKGSAAKAVVVQSSADQITLQWDPPASAVTKYFVSFRIHGEAAWVPLGEVPASPAPEYLVQYAVLGEGDFDFAIVAENSVGEQSSVHISTDPTAQPSSGWYLRWRK